MSSYQQFTEYVMLEVNRGESDKVTSLSDFSFFFLFFSLLLKLWCFLFWANVLRLLIELCSCFPEKQTKALFSLTQMHVNGQSEAPAVLAFKKLLIVLQVSGRLGGRYCFLCCLYWVPLCLRMLICAVCSPCLVLKFWKSSLDNFVRMQSYRCAFCFFANPLRLLFIVPFWTYFDFYILLHCRTRCPLVVFGSQGHFWSLLFRTDSFQMVVIGQR